MQKVEQFVDINMKRVAAIIMGGGEGKRLYPLTSHKAKPALSVGGRFKLIDFPLSNALNSDCRKIYVLTQFLGASLHHHILSTYRPDPFSGFIEILACETTPHRKTWYQGTADAVRQNLDYFIDCPVDYFLILSGDQLYRMDFRELIRQARITDSDLMIASLKVGPDLATRMGILKTDADNKVIEFREKPKEVEKIQYGSMGIYCFKRDVLIKILKEHQGHDFGKDIIPDMINQGKTYSYPFDGYWEDIGTVSSFYEANIAFTGNSPFNPYMEESPIYCHHLELPGAKIENTVIERSILMNGAVVQAKGIKNSIIGPRSVIHEDTVIESSYIMGNEFYHHPRTGKPAAIGKNCHIRKAIIDENALIGDDVKLINEDNLLTFDGPGVYIRDGIIIVSRGTTVPAKFCL